MSKGSGPLDLMRRGRAWLSIAALSILLLPILLAIMPNPAATAEYLLLRDLATAEICAMPGRDAAPSSPVQHQPDCMLCGMACHFAGASTISPLAGVASASLFGRPALRGPPSRYSTRPSLRRFASDVQVRGPPRPA